MFSSKFFRKTAVAVRSGSNGIAVVSLLSWLIVGICLAASFAHAQKNSATMQPAQQPTTPNPPQVGATHTALCMLADCNKPPKPVINGIDPSSAITPGGQVVLTGTNFNSNDHKNGDIVLTIGTKSAMTRRMTGQKFYTQPYREAHLTVMGWSDGHAYGQIPGDISSVMDGPASIQIRRSDGLAADPYSVQFTAARAIDAYPASDMKWDSCSHNGDENQCNGWADYSNPRTAGSASIIGVHVKFLKNGAPESGVDYYSFSLNNGWVWDQGRYGDYSASCANLEDNAGEEVYDSSSTGGKIKIPWQAACQIIYVNSVLINGPRGVPWK